MLDHRAELTRRHLLQGAGAATAAAFLTAGGASAQARSETLLVVQELGPNSPRHAGRRLEPDRQRPVVELLRPPDDLRLEDAGRRHALL